MVYVAKYIDVVLQRVLKQGVDDKFTHFLLCLFEAIEKLDHVVELLVIHDWFHVRLQHQQGLEHEMNLLESNQGHLAQLRRLHCVQTSD